MLLWSECLWFPKVICWNPNIQCDGIRIWGGSLGRWLDHEDRAFMNEVNTVIDILEAWESSIASSTRRGHSKKLAVCECPHQNLTRLVPWSWTSNLRTVRNKCLLLISHLIYILLKQPKWTKTHVQLLYHSGESLELSIHFFFILEAYNLCKKWHTCTKYCISQCLN